MGGEGGLSFGQEEKEGGDNFALQGSDMQLKSKALSPGTPLKSTVAYRGATFIIRKGMGGIEKEIVGKKEKKSGGEGFGGNNRER